MGRVQAHDLVDRQARVRRDEFEIRSEICGVSDGDLDRTRRGKSQRGEAIEVVAHHRFQLYGLSREGIERDQDRPVGRMQVPNGGVCRGLQEREQPQNVILVPVRDSVAEPH